MDDDNDVVVVVVVDDDDDDGDDVNGPQTSRSLRCGSSTTAATPPSPATVWTSARRSTPSRWSACVRAQRANQNIPRRPLPPPRPLRTAGFFVRACPSFLQFVFCIISHGVATTSTVRLLLLRCDINGVTSIYGVASAMAPQVPPAS